MMDLYNKSVIFVNQADEKEVLEILKNKEIEAEAQRLYSDFFFSVEAKFALDSLIVNQGYNHLLKLSEEEFEKLVNNVADYLTKNKNDFIDATYMEEIAEDYLRGNSDYAENIF